MCGCNIRKFAMGGKDIWKMLREAGCIRLVKDTSLRNMRVGLDISVVMHCIGRSCFSYLLGESNGVDTFVGLVKKFVLEVMEACREVTVVFDGHRKPDSTKSNTNSDREYSRGEARRKASRLLFEICSGQTPTVDGRSLTENEAMKALRKYTSATFAVTNDALVAVCSSLKDYNQVRCLVAEGEADVLLATLVNEHEIDIVATVDSDLVTRAGVVLNIRKKSGGVYWPSDWSKAELVLDTCARETEFASCFHKGKLAFLVDFSCFVGCDYSTVKGVGPATFTKAYLEAETALRTIAPTNHQEIVEVLYGHCKTFAQVRLEPLDVDTVVAARKEFFRRSNNTVDPNDVLFGMDQKWIPVMAELPEWYAQKATHAYTHGPLSDLSSCTSSSQRKTTPLIETFGLQNFVQHVEFAIPYLSAEVIESYMLDRLTLDNLPNANWRGWYRGFLLSDGGHVRKLTLTIDENVVQLDGVVEPTMKTGRYTCWVSGRLHQQLIPHGPDDARKQKISKFVSGNCTCPAGALQSCVHVSAIMLQYMTYSAHMQQTTIPDSSAPTCTGIKCQWIGKVSKTPHSKRVQEIMATPIKYIERSSEEQQRERERKKRSEKKRRISRGPQTATTNANNTSKLFALYNPDGDTIFLSDY